jgi:hypothetical protein
VTRKVVHSNEHGTLGWQLGSDPEIQVATVVSNHLTAGIMKYFGESFRFDPAVKFFESLYDKEPETASLLAQAYIGMGMMLTRKRAPQCLEFLFILTDDLYRLRRGNQGCEYLI